MSVSGLGKIPLRTEAQVRAQRSVWDKLSAQLHCGDVGEVEFTELAFDAGMSITRINKEIGSARGEF